MTQYVQVKFQKTDVRSYTYHNDGDPVIVGDYVHVLGRDELKTVEVIGVSDIKPPFETKPLALPPAEDDGGDE